MGHTKAVILDVRSMSVTAIVGEAGVNNTFVFKSACSRPYEGYENGRFYSVASLKKSVYAVLDEALNGTKEKFETVYVGVPGEFLKAIDKKYIKFFPSPKRIAKSDVEKFCREACVAAEERSYELVYESALYFITSDGNKSASPVGTISSSLQGRMSYAYSSDVFNETMREALTAYGFKTVRFIPSPFVQAQYLLSEEKRRNGALLLDIGAISSTIVAVYGNGVVKEQTIDIGEKHMAAAICGALDVSYDVAIGLLKEVNLFRTGILDLQITEEKRVSTEQINQIVRTVLDSFCEPLESFLSECPSIMSERPLCVTGEGVGGVRGAVEYVADKLGKSAKIVAPEIPYYNKPSVSSEISLLDYALKKCGAEKFFYKLLNGFGG